MKMGFWSIKVKTVRKFLHVPSGTVVISQETCWLHKESPRKGKYHKMQSILLLFLSFVLVGVHGRKGKIFL